MKYYIRQDDVEYLKRRAEDERKTSIIEKFTDKIYKKHLYGIRRVTDTQLQKQGVDLIYNEDGKIHYIDEKFALKYFDKHLNSFSFELYSENNKGNEGWFISDHMITTDYCILWFTSDYTFKNIRSYDLCFIPKNKILEFARKSGYYGGIVQDFLDYWEYDQYHKHDPRFYSIGSGENERRGMKLKNGCKLVQSMHFKERPINIIIPRDELYKLATYHWSNRD